jgi:hypothetical protein
VRLTSPWVDDHTSRSFGTPREASDRRCFGFLRLWVAVRGDIIIQRELRQTMNEVVGRLQFGGKVVQRAPGGHEIEIFVPPVIQTPGSVVEYRCR